MSEPKIRDDGKVELNFRVELDPENPRVVVMDLGLERVTMPFDTEEDAKRADLMLTSMGATTAVLFGVCKAEVLGAPTVWAQGTPAPSTQKAPSAEGGAEKADGAVNATKTQKDGVLSFCNVAKLREALEAAGKAAREIQQATEEADTAEVAISIAEICEEMCIRDRRNCDRFGDYGEHSLHLALGTYLNEFYHGSDEEVNADKAPMVNAFRWMLSQKTPGKGGKG